MRLHLLGLPHTITSPRWSHCGFTGKTLRFAPMMRSVGYEVMHYGIQGAESGATTQVDVLTRAEWDELGGVEPGSAQVGAQADVNTPLYHAFNQKLIRLLHDRLEPRDVLCLPFGHAHTEAMTNFPVHRKLETGIGYPVACPWFRVYESYAWMHFHLGKEAAQKHQESGLGSDYQWVIPNYYDPADWLLGTGDGGYLLYFGRLNQDKGLDIVVEIAKARPDLVIKICGQGDPKPWLTQPNIHYLPPLHGSGRAELLGLALAVLMPTRYVEPFGGVTVEAHMTGTPVLGSAFGSFTETITPGRDGDRCRTLQDWLDGIAKAEQGGYATRQGIRNAAVTRYSMWNLARDYDRVFQRLDDLWTAGWFTRSTPLTLARHQCA